MEKKLNFNIKEFIDSVDVKKNEEDGDCEYEVSGHAKFLYRKYPAYMGCDENKPIEKNGIELTADILTSIKAPINEILRRQKKNTLGRRVKGSEIKQVLLSGGIVTGSSDIERILGEIPEELLIHIKMFAYVYYWCGNMMPVISNWCPGRWGSDTWKAKINKIIECFDCQSVAEINKSKAKIESSKKRVGQKGFWLGWIKLVYESSEIEVFVNDNFLQDMVFKCDERTMTKGMLKDDSNLVRFSAIEKGEKEIADVQDWFDNATDLIIRRSYRIVYEIKEEFSLEDNKNIEMIKRHIQEDIGKVK